MKIGKLSESALQKVVFEQLHTRRDEVLVGPGIGEDCAALKLQEGEVFVTSTDPITGTVKEIGRLAVHVTANDLASAGAETIGLMVTALLPPMIKEAQIKKMMQQINAECEKLKYHGIRRPYRDYGSGYAASIICDRNRKSERR